MTIVGARPQFIKSSAITRVVGEKAAMQPPLLVEELVHTGQHYAPSMSDVFFEEFGLGAADHHLAVGSGTHAEQTGEMLKRLDPVLQRSEPDVVLVYGDTNSTLAGALAAAKLGIPVAHVEAGVRSGRRSMPEEINRVVTDQLSSLLFCPSESAAQNLASEGITEGVRIVGDVMRDVWVAYHARPGGGVAEEPPVNVEDGEYALATVHRAENTDDPTRLADILRAFAALSEDGLRVVVPIHPRTRSRVQPDELPKQVTFIDPVPYGQAMTLLARSRVLITDSGGMQKEALWSGVPCVTLRDETEWPETVSAGWNTLVGADFDAIVTAARALRPEHAPPALYGDGHAAERIVDDLIACFGTEHR
jgi:UDP-N-acetylglucosamine 2-epimerase